MLWWTLRKLKSANRNDRWEAVLKLCTMKDARANEALVGALKDEDVQIRFFAAEHLASFGDERAVQVIVDALEHNGRRRVEAAEWIVTNSESRELCARASAILEIEKVQLLVAKGEYDLAAQQGISAVRPLFAEIRGLQKEGAYAPRAKALTALSNAVLSNVRNNVKSEDALVDLKYVAFAGLDDEEIVLAVLPGLAALGMKNTLDVFQAALKHRRESVRVAAISYLAQSNDARVNEILAHACQDNHDYVLGKLAKALDARGWMSESATERIQYAIATHRYERAAAEGPAAVEPLLVIFPPPLRDSDHDRVALTKVLGDLGDPRAVKPLVDALPKYGSPLFVEPTLEALEQILARSAMKIASSDLEALVHLPPVIKVTRPDMHDVGWIKEEIDTSRLRRMAAEELARRLGSQ